MGIQGKIHTHDEITWVNCSFPTSPFLSTVSLLCTVAYCILKKILTMHFEQNIHGRLNETGYVTAVGATHKNQGSRFMDL